MFTGIIEAIGKVKRIEPVGGDMRLTVDVQSLDMSDVKLGDSIAVNGVCLTAVKFDQNSFVADVSNESISLTSLKILKAGSLVNLEKALLPTTRLGGHLVSGHVDGLGQVVNIADDGRSIKYTIQVPAELKRYIAVKGSICIDGTSLTVNAVNDDRFDINIVPHTQEKTIIQSYKSGTEVNLEVDLVARYLESLLLHSSDEKKEGLSLDLLSKAGFIG
ncbi:MAG: riboflavin synthase [Gammaproteobacteria bacterium]|nr:riboflavin synthase [Gammaproteobacteria bacterium]